MTIIAQSIKSGFALFGLLCASICAIFIALAYTGNGDQIAKMACAVQTNGVAEYSTCMYNAGASIDE